MLLGPFLSKGLSVCARAAPLSVQTMPHRTLECVEGVFVVGLRSHDVPPSFSAVSIVFYRCPGFGSHQMILREVRTKGGAGGWLLWGVGRGQTKGELGLSKTRTSHSKKNKKDAIRMATSGTLKNAFSVPRQNRTKSSRNSREGSQEITQNRKKTHS